jgi:putative endonuclease
MTNVARGHQAEREAADYLRRHGYKVLALNWRRPRAEIDIIAQKGHGPILFVEVKYREHSAQGNGLDYITARKLAQMRFAAELWVAEQRYQGEYALAALELAGPEFTVTQFIPEL